MLPKSSAILSISLSFTMFGCAALEAKPDVITKRISWERVSPQRLANVCSDLDHYKGGILGCSKWNDTECKIFTVSTLGKDSQQETFVVGHEVMHCFDGSYHN